MSTQEVINAAVHTAHNLQPAIIYELWHIIEHRAVTLRVVPKATRIEHQGGTAQYQATH